MKRTKTLWTILWIALGIRIAWDQTLAPDRTPRPLRKPFSELPMDVVGPGWEGENVSVPEGVEEVSQVSSSVCRRYSRDGLSFWFYVGYVDSWNPGAIHEPDVCFPNSGLDLISRKVVSVSRTELERAEVREARWVTAAGEPLYSLSSFYYNRQLQPRVWTLRWDNIFGVPFFAIMTLAGPPAGSPEETRAIYFEALRRALPALVTHFPVEESADSSK